ALTTKATTVPAGAACSTVRSWGVERTGGVVSLTVTEKVATLALPEASVATQRTAVTPSGKTEPLAGVAVTLGFAPQRRVALTKKATLVPAAVACSTTTLAGTLRVGGVVSRTVTVNEAELELPEASVAEH